MSDIVVLVPTRGRPDKCKDMIDAIVSTTNDEVEIILGIDSDDQYLDDYLRLSATTYVGHRKSLSGWTNYLANECVLRLNCPQYLVSMGDDHLPRTQDCHKKLRSAIEGLGVPGFAFGDDGQNGSGLCTSWMVSSEIVQSLGWMMLPGCDHMFVDNAIMDLGNAADRIVYCPDVMIEHMHHTARKSERDITYNETNTSKQYNKDLRAFRQWRYSLEFEKDLRTIRKLGL